MTQAGMTPTGVEVERPHENFLARFRERQAALLRRDPPWLSEMRREAAEAFMNLGLPTTDDEDWRYTNVAPIARTNFAAAQPGSIHCAVELIETTYWKAPDAVRLVFINGHYSPQFSVVSNAALGLKVGSLASVLQDETAAPNGWLHTFLGRSADYRRHAFTALNTALWEDGAFVRIPKGAVVAAPIHLVYVSAAGKQPLIAHPRALIVAERGVEATVIESFVGLESGVCFSNAVSEIIVEEGAHVDHYQLQRHNPVSFHVGTLQVYQGRDSRFSSNAAALGGALVRNDANAVLDAEGAECTMNGLYLADGKQHVDNHTSIEHARPHCSSRQLYNGILGGAASAVFNGRIVVKPDAQKTDAIQKNRNLLLSADATIDTKPQLEIFADDVRCTHGATIGQMDPEALFYLRSRGVGSAQARQMLIYAFAAEVMDQMKPHTVRDWTEGVLRSRLSS
jgi:Fe-S cluster assembly protein SufD